MPTQHEEGDGAFTFLLLLPAAIIGGLFSFAAMSSIRHGGNWLIAKILSWAPVMVITQVFGILLFVSCGFTFALITGNKPLANWVFANMQDFSLLPLYAIVFNHEMHFTLEPPHLLQLVIYQFILWLVIGRPLLRHWTCAMYDWGLCMAAKDKGVHPVILRREAVDIDPGYHKAAFFYANRGEIPFLPMTLVVLCGFSPYEYF